MAAIARTVKRVYEVMANYTVEDLLEDATAGMAKVFPEITSLDREVRELAANGAAVVEGDGHFFSRVSYHDARVSPGVQKIFEHGYQATIWPIAFPDAMKFQSAPSPVEQMIQKRYAWTRDAARRAVQTSATGILAQKVRAFVQDAESKDNVELKMEATNTQVNLQTMRNTTELLNLTEQDAAMKEEASRRDEDLRKGLKVGLENAADSLTRPGSAGPR